VYESFLGGAKELFSSIGEPLLEVGGKFVKDSLMSHYGLNDVLARY
jgi:hypothetical protein